MSRATLNIIGATDDLRTVIKKANDNFRALNKDIHLTEIKSGGENTKFHNDLYGRNEFKCHPILAIENLDDTLRDIKTRLTNLEGITDDINEKIFVMEEKLEDHEDRIRALEDE